MTVKISIKNKQQKPLKQFSITVNNKRYAFSLIQNGEAIHMNCEAANINQEFLTEDIPKLLIDLPNLILAEKQYRKKHNKVLRFRVSDEDKLKIEKAAFKKGYATVSAYLRDLAVS